MEWLNGILAWRQMEALQQAARAVKALASGGKSIGTVFLIVIHALGCVFFDTALIPSGEELNLDGYELVFEENFEGNELDLGVWEHRALGKRRDGYNDISQVWVEDGKLILQAEYKEDGTYGPGWYAGMVRTHEEFLYGYFEITCINNKGGGFWSAFWLNSRGMSSEEASAGGVGGAEVDIFEAFNYDKRFMEDSVSQNIHVGGYGEGLSSIGIGNYHGKNIYTENNTYGLKWTPEEYIFYINGVETARSTFEDGVSEFWEYPIISLEIPSEVKADKDFTTRMIVDSVRIYQTEEMRQIP